MLVYMITSHIHDLGVIVFVYCGERPVIGHLAEDCAKVAIQLYGHIEDILQISYLAFLYPGEEVGELHENSVILPGQIAGVDVFSQLLPQCQYVLW